MAVEVIAPINNLSSYLKCRLYLKRFQQNGNRFFFFLNRLRKPAIEYNGKKENKVVKMSKSVI